MKILLVSGHFYPEVTPRAFRTTELAKELSRQGHEVTVYAPLYDNDYHDLIEECPMMLRNLAVTWKTLPRSRNKIIDILSRSINRAAGLLFDYPRLELMHSVRNALKQETSERYDMLISIAMPHSIHWGVNLALRKNPNLAKVWVADCGDPYMGCKTDTFKKLFYFKYIEKAWCRRCDYIAVPIESAIQSYYPEFKYKIKIIPQGFDISEDLSSPDIAVNNPVPTFVFAGSFIPGVRDPKPLLEWLKTYKGDYRFHIFTSSTAYIDSYKTELGEKLEFHSYVPRDTLMRFMKKCDFLINIENGTSVQSPSKLIDYSLCRRPILSVNSKKFNEESLKEFLEGDYRRQLAPLDISQYDIRNVAKQFLDLAE